MARLRSLNHFSSSLQSAGAKMIEELTNTISIECGRSQLIFLIALHRPNLNGIVSHGN